MTELNLKNANENNFYAEDNDGFKNIKFNYLVLARKYRPQNFNQIIGQEIVLKTVINAISSNRLPHAILLSGTRGVGKTTIARIIAKAINCDNQQFDNGVCCNKCDQCIAVTKSRHNDVYEIDAASNTGVNDVRTIIDDIKYQPVQGKYKVYIIDEVHMLSISAFNALLKTLEEPPSHVKFIFATTEIKKIPLTILSRCNKFALRSLSIDELLQYYKEIVKNEGYEAEEDAIMEIAYAAGGSVRDGLSILDQAITKITINERKNITKNDIMEMLKIGSPIQIFNIIKNAILQNEIQNSLNLLNTLYYEGHCDINSILEDIMEILYEAILIKQIKIEPSNYYKFYSIIGDDFLLFVKNVDLIFLIRAWELFDSIERDIKSFKNPLLYIEMNLIKLSMMKNIPSIEESISTFREQINFDLNSRKEYKNNQDHDQKIENVQNIINTNNKIEKINFKQNETETIAENSKQNEIKIITGIDQQNETNIINIESKNQKEDMLFSYLQKLMKEILMSDLIELYYIFYDKVIVTRAENDELTIYLINKDNQKKIIDTINMNIKKINSLNLVKFTDSIDKNDNNYTFASLKEKKIEDKKNSIKKNHEIQQKISKLGESFEIDEIIIND